MRSLLFVVMSLWCAVSLFAQGMESLSPPPPDPEAVLFTELMPATAPDTSEWEWQEFGQQFYWSSPLNTEHLIVQHIVSGEVCVLTGRPCSIALHVMRKVDPKMARLMMHYVIQSADGARMEGYGIAALKQDSYRYFRYADGSWKELASESSAAKAEEVWFASIWQHISSWEQEQATSPDLPVH